MKKKFIAAGVGIVSTGFIILGGAAATVGAQETANSITPMYERIASKLGISSDNYCTAVKEAKIEAIDERVKNGDLDEAKATEIKKAVSESECGHPKMEEMKENREEMQKKVADFFGISVEELEKSREDGKTLQDLAKEYNKDLEDLKEILPQRGPRGGRGFGGEIPKDSV